MCQISTIAVIFVAVSSSAFSQVFPEHEFLDVVRTVDGSVLKGVIVSDGPGETDGPVTLEIYGGTTFVIIPENIQSISHVRNRDYGKTVPTLNLSDLIVVRDDPEEEELELPFVPDAELPTVRYPSFSGGIGSYASMGLDGYDRMIESSWYAGTLGAYIHSYDLIPMTIGLEIYGAAHGRNKHYRIYDSETDTEVNIYPHQDGFDSQLVPSFLIGNHWQSVAVGGTWLGILHERPLFMPTVQWRNLRIAANMADEGYATAQYHLPLDQRARDTRERVAALRGDGLLREYLVENNTWTRVFVRIHGGLDVSTQPEIGYVLDSGEGPEERSIAVDGPRYSGAAAGFELNRTFRERLDLGVGVEFAASPHSGHMDLEDTADGWTDEYEFRDAIGGYFRVAGYATDRLWGYGRFGMSVIEIAHRNVNNQEVGFPEIPNYGYFPHWWTDLGVGYGFLRNRQFWYCRSSRPHKRIQRVGSPVPDGSDSGWNHYMACGCGAGRKIYGSRTDALRIHAVPPSDLACPWVEDPGWFTGNPPEECSYRC